MIDATIEPRAGEPGWSETRWNGCWNPDAGVGLYLHAGRFRDDLGLWWAQVVAYLPEDRLCVDRVWARSDNPAGVTIGGFDLTMTEDGWWATYDGAGQLTTTEALAAGPQGAGVPMQPMRFEVKAVEAAPLWNMHGDSADSLAFAKDTHVQQAFTTTGTLQLGGEEHRLDGIGFKDHSSGVRTFKGWHSHRFFVIMAPDWTCHAVVLNGPDGKPRTTVGQFFRGDERLAVTRFDLPPLEDATGGPVEGPLLIELETGEHLEFHSELVHALPMTMTLDNEYVNGIDWTCKDPVALIEGKGRLTAPDGTVAWCFHERSARRSMISGGR